MTLTYWINKSNGLGWTWEISEGDYTHNLGWALSLWGAKRQLKRKVRNFWKRRMVKTGDSEFWHEYGELKKRIAEVQKR